MQIHELNSFVGTPSTTDYLAIDDGTETNKVPATALGVSTQMTQAEAEAGTITAPRVVSPSVFKTSVESLAEAIAETREVLVVTVASFSSLPQTVTNSNITSDMVVVNSVLGTPSAQTGDWTVTAANGSATIAGSISGSTTLILCLMKSRSGNGATSTTSTIKRSINTATADVLYSGTYTIPSSCYLNIAKGSEPFKGHTVLAINLTSWGTNTGAFSVSSNSGNEVYLLGNNGVKVTNLGIRVTYLV